MKFFHLEREFFRYKPEYLAAIEKVLDSGLYLEGKLQEEFEQKFAQYTGAKYAVALGSGADALTMALLANGIGNGDEVITTNFAPAAHLYPILRAGARPVFVDIDPKTGMMDYSQLEQAITPFTRAIIPFHFHGYCDDMDQITAFARKHNLTVIENAWQAVGTFFNGKHVGTFGKMGVFSFYPTTTLGGFGDSGAIITDDRDVYDLLVKMRHSEHFDQNIARKTFISRMNEIQAAFLIIKMKYLRDMVFRRQRIAHLIKESLPELNFIQPRPGCEPNYYVLTFLHPDREKMIDYLDKMGLHLNVYYPYVLNKLDKSNPLYYKHYPVSEMFSKQIVSLPPCAELSKYEVEKMINIIKSFYDGQEQ